MRNGYFYAGALTFLFTGACASNPEPIKVAPPIASATASPTGAGATAAVASEPTPEGSRLPADVRPSAQAIELRLDPSEARFSGKVDIAVRLDKPRGVIWLHGKKLDVAVATVTPKEGAPIAARFEMRDPTGLASLTLAREIPAGDATVHLEFGGEYAKSLKGLYKATQSGKPYAFTQFEATAAREAFPCFDEPGMKIPFDVTLVVPKDAQAIANTHDVSSTDEGAMKRVKFATTPPLPTYLVAFAVGPLDVVKAPDVPPNAVRKRPLPLRGITAAGRGKEIAYALAHTGELVAAIEKYFGVEYPYDKLDILAVPDKGGAMENAGAITFREFLLLMDEKSAPIWQKKSFFEVMAHELAHQWTGDLVTMKWWDDTWLNEAFATWMAPKAVGAVDPKLEADLSQLAAGLGAMGTDSLVSARSIRQPIASHHDIENAFDGITYRKGASVIRMFEEWMGEDAFARGMHAYLDKFKNGNASADDLLDVLSETSGKDVKTPFHTFLDQPGVPFVEASIVCGGDGGPKVHLKQSRYLPLGSSGETAKTWQIPVALKVGQGTGPASKTTTLRALFGGEETDVVVPGACPTFVMPNAGADGYYRFSLAPKDLEALKKTGLARMSVREKMAFDNAVRAGFSKGTTMLKDAVLATAPLASDPHPRVAMASAQYFENAHEWLFTDPARANVEAQAKALYRPAFDKLGWTAAKNEDQARTQLRGDLLFFLTMTARDKDLRGECAKRARAYVGFGGDNKIHPDAVDTNLANVVLAVAGEDADAAFFDAVLAQLWKTEDDALRSRLLTSLAFARKPELAERARAIALDPRLRLTEVFNPIAGQLGSPETREATWQWLKTNIDALFTRIPAHHGGAHLVSLAGEFCDEDHASDAEAFWSKRVDGIEGGPRALASTIESIRLCAARRKAQEPSARELFAKPRP